MIGVRIEHDVPDYDGWMRAFDSDLSGDGGDGDSFRKALGVRRYRVSRAVDAPQRVIIDLEYDTAEAAEEHLARMREIWSRVQGSVIAAPTVTAAEIVRDRTL